MYGYCRIFGFMHIPVNKKWMLIKKSLLIDLFILHFIVCVFANSDASEKLKVAVATQSACKHLEMWN